MPRQDHEQNRASWNAVTPAHNSHKNDQAAFLKAGNSTLYPEEISRLLPLQDQRLLHLQCNCGQDTLSLAQLGAQATGVDISDEAIAFAQSLSQESQIGASFERADVLDWLEQAATQGRSFDRVFSSYGVVGWLNDLQAWARGIAGVLAPQGRFVLVEFHPFLWTMGEDGKPADGYFGEHRIIETQGVTDYVASSGEALAPSGFSSGIENFQNPHSSVEFRFTPGDVVTALAQAGLFIEELTEFPHSNGYRPSTAHIEERPGIFIPGPELHSHPMMFAVVATNR